MSEPSSARHQLPFLAVNQAQKEITHNESLWRVDALLHPVVEDALDSPPSVSESDAGKCWIVGAGAAGDWAGNAHQIASWTGGSWRFLAPSIGMRIWCSAAGSEYFWDGGEWIASPEIADPSGGSIVDLEARSTLANLLEYLRTSGRLAP